MKSGDLVFNEIEGVFYKKFTDVPFTGEVTGERQGKLKNGKKKGPWGNYHENGKLFSKGTYKNGKREGPWFGCNYDGTVDKEWTGTFKDGKKVK